MALSEEDKMYMKLLVLKELEVVIADVLINNEKLIDSDEKTIEGNLLFRLRSAIQSRKSKIELGD